MAERVVGGEAVPLPALDHAIAQQRLPARIDIHAIGGFGVKHVPVARLPAQFVRIASGVEKQRAVALGDLRDREARCRADLADDRRHLVAFDQAFRLGRSRLRIHAVLGDQFDLATHHAATAIDLVDREIDTHHRVLAQRPEKTRARREMTDPDGFGLAAHDGGKSQGTERCSSTGTLQQTATATTDRRMFHDSSC